MFIVQFPLEPIGGDCIVRCESCEHRFFWEQGMVERLHAEDRVVPCPKCGAGDEMPGAPVPSREHNAREEVTA